MKLAALGGAAVVSGLPRRAAWAAAGPQDRKVRFAFFTDVHARPEWDTPAALQKAAQAINAAGPDFVIAGGDLITDGFQQGAAASAPRWKIYMDMHRAIEADVHPAIGNHDLVAAVPEDGSPALANPRSVFCGTFGLDRTFRSMDLAGCHFIFLDAVHVRGGVNLIDRMPYHGLVPPEQIAWLKEDVSGVDAATPIVAVSHMPLLTGFYQATQGAAEHAPKNRVVVNNREVLQVFEGKNLLLVLQGHLHVEEMLTWRGTTFITGGAVCGRWWRGPHQGTEEGFGLLTLDGRHIDWQYVDYGWEAMRPAGK